MKVTLHCAHCLLERAINQVKLATDDEKLRMRVISAMLDFLAKNFNEDSVPSYIGTDRDLLVQRMTGKDPYAELKKMSNKMALEIMPELEKLVNEINNEGEKFRWATLVAAAANAIEFDVSGRKFDLDELRTIVSNVKSDLTIDQIDEFRELCRTTDHVLYLMDNAGEIVLDMILIREIKKLGPKVIAVVRGGPVLNDATMSDAIEVGLGRCADEVIDTGVALIGVHPERVSKEFLQVFNNAELIVAKGMGNFESLTELEPGCPIVHILRTKCEPVAQQVGVERNKNVIFIRR